MNKRSEILIGNSTWIALLLLELVVIGYYIFFIKPLHYDEFESIHAGWKILNGEKIYEEFDELHHPLPYYILAIIIKIFDETITSVYASTLFISFISIGIIYVSYLFCKNIFNHESAIIFTIFLPLTPWFTLSAFEVRPDIPMLFFGIVSIYCLYNYFDNKNIWLLIISAFCLGMSFLFLQKAVFFFASITAILIHRYFNKEIIYRELIIYIVTTLLIYALFLFILSQNISLESYFFFCFEYIRARSADIGGTNNFTLIVKEISQPDRLVWLIFPAFISVHIFYRLTRPQKEIMIMALWLLLTVVFAIVPYDQYFLPATIFIVMIVAYGFVTLVKKYLLNSVPWLLLLIVISGSANYFNIIVDGPQNRDKQIARVNYVLKHTDSDDYVYDGCNMYNLFRKDLDFFWYAGHDKIPSYQTYSAIKSYDYNIYTLIDQKDPRIISPCFINLFKYKWILNEYRQTKEHDYLFVQYKNNTGFNHWHTFTDNLGTGTYVDPGWDFFTPAGDIEVSMNKAKNTINNNLYPYVGIAMDFHLPTRPVDLSNTDTLVVNYKLSSPISLLLSQEGITSGDEYRVELLPVRNYSEMTIEWIDFKAPEWSENMIELDLKKITGIKFQITTQGENSTHLGIRNIKFTNLDSSF